MRRRSAEINKSALILTFSLREKGSLKRRAKLLADRTRSTRTLRPLGEELK